jgi:uncharacterized membrane protein YbhN (UPF0104 family)
VIAANKALLNVILPEPLDWLTMTLLFVVSTVGAAASTLPGGTGGFHGAVMLTLLAMDVPASEAATAALALHIQQFLITLPFALVFLRREHLDIVAWLRRAKDGPPVAPLETTPNRSSPS